MARWDWLTKHKDLYTRYFILRVVLKATGLFVLFNLIFVFAQPMNMINDVTLYNTVFPGRDRLPYSDNPQAAYNLSLGSLDAMFASHIITENPVEDEFRVAIIGDSSVWGVLLDNDQTLSSCLNTLDLKSADGRRITVYNLGYPVLSVFKDVLLLEEGLNYDLDAVIWLTTLQALFEVEQLRHPILNDNASRVRAFIAEYNLDLDSDTLPESTWWDRTIVGQRRALSDWLRFQAYGIAWWMTGEDYASARYLGAPVRNLPDSQNILNQPQIDVGDLIGQDVLAWDVLMAGYELAAMREVPVLLVNEPIYRSDGLNNELRYNEYYPRWAYDEYRAYLAQLADDNGWPYLDLWDSLEPATFTDTPFHYEADVVCDVAELISPHLLAMID